jgi:membrane protein
VAKIILGGNMSKILLKKIIKVAFNPKSFWVKTSIAYFMLLALIPAFGIIAFLLQLINIPTGTIIPYLDYIFPTGTAKMIEEYLLTTNFEVEFIGLFFTLIFSFNIVSGGIDTLSMLSNDMFGLKNTSFIKRKSKSVLMTLIIIVVIIILIGSSVFFPTLLHINYSEYLMFPLLWIGLLLLIIFLFMYSPVKRMKFKEIILGSIFSSLTIAILLQFYRVYIKYFGRFDTFYGPLATIIILLILFQWMASMLYYGISINVVVYSMYKK